MIRKIFHTFWMVALVLGCLSCVREELVPATGGVGEGEGLLLLNFGVNESVEVQTKATLPAHTEQGVFNMYVFVFDKDLRGNSSIVGTWRRVAMLMLSARLQTIVGGSIMPRKIRRLVL